MIARLPRLCLLALIAYPITWAGAAWAGQAAQPPACAAPAGFAAPDSPLAAAGAALKAGGPVNILAIGSATTIGDRHTAFPERMIDALQSARPGIAFKLTLRGGRGMTAQAMLPQLKTALASQRYALVLWQTGTVEAVHGDDPNDLQSALQEGIDAAIQAGANVVLIDSQFSRFLRANANLDPYESALQQAAVMPGVALFHRYGLMQSWAEDGTIDLESASRAGRPKAKALLNSCLGETLARFVLAGAGLATQ